MSASGISGDIQLKRRELLTLAPEGFQYGSSWERCKIQPELEPGRSGRGTVGYVEQGRNGPRDEADSRAMPGERRPKGAMWRSENVGMTPAEQKADQMRLQSQIRFARSKIVRTPEVSSSLTSFSGSRDRPEAQGDA